MNRHSGVVKGMVGSALAIVMAGGLLLRAQETKSLTAEEIMDRSAKAQWGDKYKGLTSYRYELEVNFVAQGMKATVVATGKAPNKSHTVLEIPNMIKQEQAYDGQVAWARDSMQGLREKEDTELAEAKHDAWFYSDAEWRDHYKKVTLKREDMVDDRKVYVLELEIEGLEPRTHTIDAETFLPVSSTSTSESPQGTIEVETEYLEYKALEGEAWGKITMPWKVRQSAGGQVLDVQIKKAEGNVEVSDSLFSMPKEEEDEGDDEDMNDEDGGKKKEEGGK
ncbi:MAG: hypothetical protein HYY93_12235 [Planctomycetes bacterium]|nr:hypothetical protein [Planctomycetota bacterium]